MSQVLSNKRVIILLTAGFEETVIVGLMEQMRRASLPVSLVGLSVGTITGLYGLSIRPDLTLDQIEGSNGVRLVIIPGGRQCATGLLADPRVHRLFQSITQNQGSVAITTAASAVTDIAYLQQTMPNIQLIFQNGDSVEVFADNLINLVCESPTLLKP